jgi:hypothetical protein
VLKEYKQMIAGTTDKLEMRLERLDDDLDSLPSQQRTSSDGDAIERGPLQQERESTKQCLDICAQVSTHIVDVQLNVFENICTPTGTQQKPVTTLVGLISAHEATRDALKVCEGTLSRTSSRLQHHLQQVDTELRSLSSESQARSSQANSQQGNLEAEVESTKQALAYMAQASAGASENRVNLYEDITTADESHQVIISTIGDLISAKHVSAGSGSSQWMGQMSDESLQNLTNNLTRGNIGRGPETQPGGTARQFEGRYGAGYKFGSQDSRAVRASPPKGT